MLHPRRTVLVEWLTVLVRSTSTRGLDNEVFPLRKDAKMSVGWLGLIQLFLVDCGILPQPLTDPRHLPPWPPLLEPHNIIKISWLRTKLIETSLVP